MYTFKETVCMNLEDEFPSNFFIVACELLIETYGMKSPDQGLNFEPGPPGMGSRSPSHWTTKSPPQQFL